MLIILLILSVIIYFIYKREKKEDNSNSGELLGYEYVDLGLPSGNKWATCNVGANKPYEYGDYYAWGEIYTKLDYSAEEYKYKLNPTVLPSKADVAHFLLKGNWRIPSLEDFKELIACCEYNEKSLVGGVWGCEFKSKINSKKIFFPYTGFIIGMDFFAVSDGARYWSSSINLDDLNEAFQLLVADGRLVPKIDVRERVTGCPIRPIFTDKKKKPEV